MPHAKINGASLWYEVRGSGEPLLLHHGYTASRVNWMPVAERLQDRYQIILMECRGAGQSEHTPDGYTLEQYAADVVGLLDHLGLARVTFAGHSMGGGIGYLLGLDHPQRLDRLILMAPIPSEGVAGITPEIRAERLDERALALWETAARYLMYGGFGMTLLGIVGRQWPRPGFEGAAWSLLLGTVVFSGTVVALALGGPRWLGAVTPLGGVLLIAGFLLFAWTAFRI